MQRKYPVAQGYQMPTPPSYPQGAASAPAPGAPPAPMAPPQPAAPPQVPPGPSQPQPIDTGKGPDPQLKPESLSPPSQLNRSWMGSHHPPTFGKLEEKDKSKQHRGFQGGRRIYPEMTAAAAAQPPIGAMAPSQPPAQAMAGAPAPAPVPTQPQPQSMQPPVSADTAQAGMPNLGGLSLQQQQQQGQATGSQSQPQFYQPQQPAFSVSGPPSTQGQYATQQTVPPPAAPQQQQQQQQGVEGTHTQSHPPAPGPGVGYHTYQQPQQAAQPAQPAYPQQQGQFQQQQPGMYGTAQSAAAGHQPQHPAPQQQQQAYRQTAGAPPPSGTRFPEQFRQPVPEYQWDAQNPPRPGIQGQPDEPLFTEPLPHSADKRLARLSINACPANTNLLTQCSLPFGVVLHPFAEDYDPKTGTSKPVPVKVVNFGQLGIVRCRRCRAYINPFVEWIEGGRRWRCNLCYFPNECPVEYFSPLDATGKRTDLSERAELNDGVVEFVAASEYMVRPPAPVVYLFVIDVSYASVSAGILHIICQTLKEKLDDLAADERAQIGFISFDSAIQFYQLSAHLAQPQVMVVSDINDPFLPLPDDLLVNIQDSRHVIEALLDRLPSMYQNTQRVESALGPALQVAQEVIAAVGGKIIIFQAMRPSLGRGALAARDDPKHVGAGGIIQSITGSGAQGPEAEFADPDTKLFRCVEDFYKELALDLSRLQTSVDVCLFSGQYQDAATLSVLPKFTGGQIFHYPNFTAATQGETFHDELVRMMTRTTALEGVMRLRTTRGVIASTFHGHFFIRNSDLLALPAIDADKSLSARFSIDDIQTSQQHISVQAAHLHTTTSGERRIRVYNLCIPVVQTVGDLLRAADQEAVMTLITQTAIDKAMSSKLQDGRDFFFQKVIDIVKAFRQYNHGSSYSQMALPETLSYLPLYVLALAKHTAFRVADRAFGRVAVDQRVFDMSVFKSFPTHIMMDYLVPLLYDVTEADRSEDIPPRLPLSREMIQADRAYALFNGLAMFLWLGSRVPAQFVENGLGITKEALDGLSSPQVKLRRHENAPLNAALWRVHDLCKRRRRGLPTPIVCLKDGEHQSQMILGGYLIEDATTSVMGYIEYLNHVQQKTSGQS